MNFTPRLTRPSAGNKYYITKAAGGYSAAIQGSPADTGCNVLANCVGYAYGRFNEIVGEGCCRYLRPVNAENFIQYAEGLDVGQEPRLGACMVWQKGATLVLTARAMSLSWRKSSAPRKLSPLKAGGTPKNHFGRRPGRRVTATGAREVAISSWASSTIPPPAVRGSHRLRL